MSDLGDQILSQVSGGKDVFTSLMSKIPGFSGYVKRQERRNSDKLLRETISDRFDEQWQRASALQQELLSAGQIALVDDMEKAAIKLRTFADRIKTTSRGYSSFFEAIKIDEAELDRLLAYDNALLDMGEEVSRAVDHVEASIGGEGLPAAIRNLIATAQKCIDAFNRREEIILAVE